MGKNGGGKLSQWAKIKIVCKVVRGKLQKAHTMGYLTVPGQESGRGLSRLSSSCPSLNVDGEELDDDDSPSCSEEFLDTRKGRTSSTSECHRRRSWSGLSDEEKKRARHRRVYQELQQHIQATLPPLSPQDESSPPTSPSPPPIPPLPPHHHNYHPPHLPLQAPPPQLPPLHLPPRPTVPHHPPRPPRVPPLPPPLPQHHPQQPLPHHFQQPTSPPHLPSSPPWLPPQPPRTAPSLPPTTSLPKPMLPLRSKPPLPPRSWYKPTVPPQPTSSARTHTAISSISLSSLDSDAEEAFYDAEDSTNTQGSDSVDGGCRRAVEKQRSMSGSSSPVTYGGGSSTHSLNDVHLQEKRSSGPIEKPRLLAPRLTLQKSVSTPSILAGVTTQPPQQQQTQSSYQYEDDSSNKRRKRGSIFFRKKKDKTKKSSHQFVSVCYSNSATCDVCSKPMTNKPALRCE
ncbi:hypothetical protein OTU49_017410, partial [Cherax quadricarinatus]